MRLLPFLGDAVAESLAFRHEDETAAPGFYAVKLDGGRVSVEVDRPFASVQELPRGGKGKALRYAFDFDLKPGEKFAAKLDSLFTQPSKAKGMGEVKDVSGLIGQYALGAPQVPKVTLSLAGGKTFTVLANNLSRENRHVKSVTLNGKPLAGWKIRHADVMSGGELVFEMGK